jgi:hypothetical protein
MENFNLKKFLVENKLTTNSRMLNESLEDDNERLFRKMSDAPDKITIQITENGKNLMRKVFKEILERSQPDYYRKSHPDWFPSTIIDLADKITLEKKYYPEISRTETPREVGSMKINQPQTPHEKRWTTLSDMFKYSNGKSSTDTFKMYAFYLPFTDKIENDVAVEKGALIRLNAGVEFDTSVVIGNFSPENKGSDYFDKIEIGEVSNNGYFKIVSIP